MEGVAQHLAHVLGVGRQLEGILALPQENMRPAVQIARAHQLRCVVITKRWEGAACVYVCPNCTTSRASRLRVGLIQDKRHKIQFRQFWGQPSNQGMLQIRPNRGVQYSPQIALPQCKCHETEGITCNSGSYLLHQKGCQSCMRHRHSQAYSFQEEQLCPQTHDRDR